MTGPCWAARLIFADSGKYQFFGSRRGKVLDQSEYFSIADEGYLLQQDAIETDFILGAALLLPAGCAEEDRIVR